MPLWPLVEKEGRGVRGMRGARGRLTCPLLLEPKLRCSVQRCPGFDDDISGGSSPCSTGHTIVAWVDTETQIPPFDGRRWGLTKIENAHAYKAGGFLTLLWVTLL